MTKLRISPLFLATWALLCTVNGFYNTFTLFTAAFFHECGHILAFCLMRAEIDRIELLSFGASVTLKPTCRLRCGQEIFVSLAGICVNLLWAAALLLLPGFSVVSGRSWTAICHVMLAAVNLIPIEPLDGGRALYYAVLAKSDPEKAKSVCTWVGLFFLIPLGGFSVWLWIKTGYNFSLFLITVYLFISLRIKK